MFLTGFARSGLLLQRLSTSPILQSCIADGATVTEALRSFRPFARSCMQARMLGSSQGRPREARPRWHEPWPT
ncbi:hypothetical protein BCV70DRAFT_199034 [Testicularia cyperi]|uniref:Uncharacterized protein n=1 Tax=Testicularia cyperi TaxID=1882483 RepID=A0A317XUX2_9BASI|nr:hypothetical protein BCV70DRAFT_199034 [Testicularia cyperi]